MQGTILLDYNENTRKVEEEEKLRFLKSLLEQMNVPIHEFWTSDHILSIEEKIKLRNILTTFNIKVLENLEGLMQIFVDNDIIATWHKPTYKLKRDLSKPDPRKQLYLEMTINYESVFDE